MMNCREATYLASKREEGKLTLKEYFSMQFHMVMCRFCKNFYLQNKLMARHAKLLGSKEQPAGAPLPEETRLKLKELIK